MIYHRTLSEFKSLKFKFTQNDIIRIMNPIFSSIDDLVVIDVIKEITNRNRKILFFDLREEPHIFMMNRDHITELHISLVTPSSQPTLELTQHRPYDIILINQPIVISSKNKLMYSSVMEWSSLFLSGPKTIFYIIDGETTMAQYAIATFLSYTKQLTQISTTRKLMKQTCAFYTAIFSTDQPIDRPIMFKKILGWDYYLFTNLNASLFKTAWEIKTIPYPIVTDTVLRTNQLSVKDVKHNSHRYLPNHDVVIYMDGYVWPDPVKSFVLFTQINLLGTYDIILQKHPNWDCVYQEAKQILRCRKDTHEHVNRNLAVYNKEQMPCHWGLSLGGVLIKNNQSPQLIEISEQIVNFMRDKSYRDQLTMMYIFWKYKFQSYFMGPKFTFTKQIESRRGYNYV